MKNKFSFSSFLFVLALTTLISVVVQAQAWDPVLISGQVTDYSPADCGKAGSITIAKQKLTIAAGADTIFTNNMLFCCGSNGGLTTGNVKSEVWQVIGSGRSLAVYLDGQNRVRVQYAVGVNGPTSSHAFDVTGVVTSTSPLIIHGLTFPITAVYSPAAPAIGSFVRITGTMDVTDTLIGTATVLPTYRNLTLCGAPALYRSVGGLEVPDTNSFDPAGPISGLVDIFNPQGTAAVAYLCDEGQERISVDGSANILVAPNFSLQSQVSKDVNSCFELQIDAFNSISNGSKKMAGTGNSITGVLSAAVVQGYGKGSPSETYPTTRNEAAQRGSVVISGVSFTIAPNHAVTLFGGPTVGNQVTLIPVIDPAGQNGSPLAPGWPFPPRAGNLITGSTLTKQ